MSEEQKKQSTPQDDEAVEEAETIIEDAQGVVDDGGASQQQGAAKPMADDTDEITGATTGAEEPVTAAGENDIIEQLRADLAATQAKADEYLDRLQRTAADFQNSRRRMENQLSEEVGRANAALIMRLLPVLDDLDLAFQNVPEELRTKAENNGGQVAWLEGFTQIRKKLFDVLADEGVTPVPTDGAFDPHLHDAISSEPSDTVESGHIIEVMRAGYEYKGRVLRPALVRVAM
jgi:molecular chaperone GrpE